MHWPPDYQPAPPISVDTPNCSIYGAWWVEGDGPDTAHVYPRNRDITVDGTKYYKFVLNLHPDEGYEFTSETTVTISTGSVLSSEFYPGDEWNASAIIAVFEIPATHDWGEWTVTKEPTTTAPGERVRVCKHFLTPPRLGLFPRLTTLRQPLTTALIPPTVAAVRRLPATVPVPPAVLSIGARVARERPFPRASFPLVLRQQAMSIMVSLPSPTRVIRLRAAWTVSAPVPRSAA